MASSFLLRLIGRSTDSYEFELIALRLRLLTAMAAADDRITELEVDALHDFVERVAPSASDRARLDDMLDELFEAPPKLDEVLDDLAGHAEHHHLGQALVMELAHLAGTDDEIDHREEFLLDLVCDAFGLPLVPIDEGGRVPDVDLEAVHRFVRKLARTKRAA